MSGEIDYTIPDLTTPGSEYAQEIDTALTNIQGHTHDGLTLGAQIDLAKQLLSGDLQLDGYNLGEVRSVEFESQPSALTGGQDVNALYVNQNNLGFNNSNGIFVPITAGNSLAITSLPFTNFYVRQVFADAVILPTDTYNMVKVTSSVGAITVTLPISTLITPTASGRLYIISDVSFNASVNNITIQVTPASGNTFDTGATSISITNNGGYVAIWTDGFGTWYKWSQNMYNSNENVSSIGTNWLLSGGSFFLENSVTVDWDSTTTFTNNGALDQNGNASFNGDVFFNSPVVFGIIATIHTTAGVTLQAQTTAINNSTVNLAASSINLDHFSSISITAGSFSNTGGTTLTGPTNITNPTISGGMTLTGGGNITGNVTFTGGTMTIDDNININSSTIFTANTGVNIHTNSFIQFDNSSVIETDGLFKNMGPNRIKVTLISYGTYNINSSTDNYIAVDTSLSGLTQVTFPATPTTGDTYAIGDAADNLTAATILLLGNGHNFLLPGGSSTFTYPHTNGLCIRWVFANNCWVQTV